MILLYSCAELAWLQSGSKLSGAWWPVRKRKESLQLRLWNLNIRIKKVYVKCRLVEPPLVMTSLHLVHVTSMFAYIRTLFRFTLIGRNLTAQSTGSHMGIDWRWNSIQLLFLLFFGVLCDSKYSIMTPKFAKQKLHWVHPSINLQTLNIVIIFIIYYNKNIICDLLLRACCLTNNFYLILT